MSDDKQDLVSAYVESMTAKATCARRMTELARTLAEKFGEGKPSPCPVEAPYRWQMERYLQRPPTEAEYARVCSAMGVDPRGKTAEKASLEADLADKSAPHRAKGEEEIQRSVATYLASLGSEAIADLLSRK